MTITKLTVEGEYKENCLFAGLAIYQGLREDILFCSNRSFWNSNTTDRTKETHHTITASNDMSLVIYAIRNYTMVFTSLSFKLSTCNGVTINPCEYDVYCDTNSSRLALCKSYIESLTTADTQFKLKIRNITQFESLHKIYIEYRYTIALTQKPDSCLQIYFSSSVKARTEDIFQDSYRHYFRGTACYVLILPEIGNLKTEMENWALYASYMGKINRLEAFGITGTGKIVVNHMDKYIQKQEKNNKIIIEEEKDFQTKYDIMVQDDVKLRVETLSAITHNKDRKLNNNKIFLWLQGGSYSSLLVSLIVHQLEVLNKMGILSTLTSWQIFNIMSSNYIVSLMNIDNKNKTKQLLSSLKDLNSLSYGYSLHVTIKNNSISSHTNNVIVATLKLQTKFCICKCLIRSKWTKNIYDLKKCNILISNYKSETKGLFAEIYNDHCTTNSTLDWSMDLYASDLQNSRGLEVLLPGIYEKVEVDIYYQNYPIKTNGGLLKIKWQDKRILETVNTSLLLNGKQYFLFSENMNQRKHYSWNEAKKLCTK